MRSEKELQLELAQNLRSKKNAEKIILEVPFKHKKIDVVVIDELITSIEVKLRNWKNVLKQAAVNLLFSDISFIAMPEEVLNDKIVENAKNLNVGVISINSGDYKVIFKPIGNPYKLQFYSDLFHMYLEKGDFIEI
ncbi:MAG: hypothetical protein ACTSWN_01495 [Promethearchaeota archaeon]